MGSEEEKRAIALLFPILNSKRVALSNGLSRMTDPLKIKSMARPDPRSEQSSLAGREKKEAS